MFTIGGTSNRGFYSFEPTGSLRFEDGDIPYLERTPSSAGNKKTFTISLWTKVGNRGVWKYLMAAGTSNNGGQRAYLVIDGSDRIYFQIGDSSANTSRYYITSAKFRDPSSWYHIVLVVDTTRANSHNSTEGTNRVELYVNGEFISWNTATNAVGQNYNNGLFNAATNHYIGTDHLGKSASTNTYDGYMSEIYFIDGTAHDADTFGETKNGVWMPKDAKGSLTFGTNGFYLPFNNTVTSEGQSTVLYEGTGANRSVEGFGYKPDMVWLKDRSNVRDHMIFDRVRGVQMKLPPNDTYASSADEDTVRSFNSDGITMGDDVKINASGAEYVAWAWDAGADQTPTGFGCVTWRGSSSIRPVRDVGFTPDLVWIKSRAAQGPNLFDSVRGANKALFSDGTGAEFSDTDRLMSFDSDGFTLGSDTNINNSSNDYVAWCWDAGDGDAASNTDGDITSTVKASDTHGFSIGTFTKGSGTQTVGHGLSAAPDWLMVKRYSGGTGSWAVYHSANTANPETDYLRLNSTNGTADDATFWGDTAPTSSVFSVGSAFNSGEKLLFYAWTEKSGYSKFGSYTGNGSATGPQITGLGFRPAWIMIKRTDSARDWVIIDTTRDPLGTTDKTLIANVSDAEYSNIADLDILSDGFQPKTSGVTVNASGGTYIYMAFAGGLDTIAPLNTDGDIDSRVKASDDTGFSVVRYEGTGTAGDTVGHGLSAAPDWIVTRRLDSTSNWLVYHSAITDAEDKYLSLETTNAVADNAGPWNDTAPTSSVFSVGAAAWTNTSGGDYVAYCWKATTGKSAFGSYTGTAASGNSVTGLGFKPGFVMVKNITDSATEWMMFDNMRDPDADDVDTYLKANSSAAETTNNANVLFSFDSDGFTVDGAGNDTNGSGDTFIYMAFADGRDASFFHDESGQGNSFEPENLQNYDVVPDSPTNNFCTLNPLATSYITPPNYAEGNLEAIGVSNYHKTVFAGMGVTSGKWYFEGRAHGGNKFTIGLSDVGNMSYKQLSTTNAIIGYTPSGLYAHGDAVGVYARTLRKNGSTVASSMWNGYAAGDIMGIAFDADAGKVWFHQNGTWSNGSGTDSITLDPNNHDTTVTTGETYVPAFSMEGPAGWFVNFGQDDSFAGTVTPGGYTDANERGSFKYPVPDGFLSLCTANLPEPDISPANGQEPEDYFNTVLYTGNGYSTTNTQSITGVGFQSDWTWIKNRNGTGSHTVFDVVRGAGKSIRTDLTDTESTQTDSLTSFDSDGFSLGDNSESGAHVNVNNSTYVAWNWLAGGTASSNTDGSITSSVSANTKAGFSVVSYTGDGTASTIGHGLNSAPEMYIVKDRESGDNWVVYHKDLTSASYYLTLDTTNAQTSNNVVFNGTDPTSTVFSVGTSRSTNGNDFIAYCFHSVPGYSLVSSYTGNSSSDGVFVHCGFSPAFILGKSSSSAGDNWYIFDNKRDTENVAGKDLNPDSSAAEADSDLVDFLSNGFKWRASSGLVNDSTTFIFYAVAEMPFKYSTGR